MFHPAFVTGAWIIHMKSQIHRSPPHSTRRSGDKPSPRMRVVCIPTLGGTASDFEGWDAIMPPDVQCVAFQPPGRGPRHEEDLPATIGDYVAEITAAMEDIADLPYVLYGQVRPPLSPFPAPLDPRAPHGEQSELGGVGGVTCSSQGAGSFFAVELTIELARPRPLPTGTAGGLTVSLYLTHP
jgi:hypothetical protein